MKKIKKNEIIRPIESYWLNVSYYLCVLNFGSLIALIHVLTTPIYEMGEKIGLIIICSTFIVFPFIIMLIYFSWKVVAYKDRMIKYSFFKKTTYYYKDLTAIEKEYKNIERNTISFYFNGKRILKYLEFEAQNSHILTVSYYRYKRKHN